jgi:mannose-6-phosphate isomerase-like protein (cupin superfamily)
MERNRKAGSREARPPWGRWSVLEDGDTFKVKRIEVLPGKRLSYQKHFKRQEHWYVVSGKARVTIDGAECLLEAGRSIDIRKGALHRIENVGEEPVVLIEVQTGEYFGEDDIVRVEDDFGRL